MSPIALLPVAPGRDPVGPFGIADTAIIPVSVQEYFLELILAPDPHAHFLDLRQMPGLPIIALPGANF